MEKLVHDAAHGARNLVTLRIVQAGQTRIEPHQFGFDDVGGERTTADSGAITVLPDLTQARAKSVARVQLDAINAAITSVVSGKFAVVSFNGQTFTRQNLDVLMRQRTDLAAQVYQEEQAEKVARGATVNTRIPIQFVTP